VTAAGPLPWASGNGGGCAAADLLVPAKGYRAAPPASSVLRIALRATALRAALDPGDLCSPAARGTRAGPACPAWHAGTSRSATPLKITTMEVSTV
jgi:hypothetical protein